jgi:hypothetical protein
MVLVIILFYHGAMSVSYTFCTMKIIITSAPSPLNCVRPEIHKVNFAEYPCKICYKTDSSISKYV